MENNIRHQGIVEKVEKHKVFVRIEQLTACSACHARTACLASDKKDKIIEVDDPSGAYAASEQVIVSVRSSVGFFAVLTAFVIPLACVVIAVIIGTNKSGNEGIGGLAGLLTLILYYLILYIFRDKMRRKFVFSLSKTQNT
ncbi:MAG: SoxR reducing system RseC family protein [Tannerella sp.]|jgi:sigma-E factor negative regulatory protein RseC|nr:SoxR reducing system RseC family protein [Tannerella sp.]